MAFIIKWNLFIGIVAFMAYVVQKIMGKRLGHYWRKVVWILLTIKMCFPFWSVTEKFRQHFFIISMPAYYMGCIFRKNCASVPEERSAIPLQTEQSSAG